MSYYRIVEMAIALISGLTFALVGGWEIVGEILNVLRIGRGPKPRAFIVEPPDWSAGQLAQRSLWL